MKVLAVEDKSNFKLNPSFLMSVPRLRVDKPVSAEICCLVMAFYLSLLDAIEP